MDRFSPHQQSIREHRLESPDQPCLLISEAIACDPHVESALRQALASMDDSLPVVLTVLTNHSAAFNPFAGLERQISDEQAHALAPGLVSLLGSGKAHATDDWPSHLALVSPAAQEILAAPDVSAVTAASALRRAGGGVWVIDSLFVSQNNRPIVHEQSLEPHEEARPKGWAVLTMRLDEWLGQEEALPGSLPSECLQRFEQGSQAVSLHVTHSWGGGVAQWIESFIAADEDGINLQLRAEGPRNDEGCGQRFSLYLANQLEAPIARWWLQPPIQSTQASNQQYREMLTAIQKRFGIGRIMVSSLVGHTLESLCTGIPTIQVIHDFYPRWPLLGVHPGPYLNGSGINLAKALTEHENIRQLADLDADRSDELSAEWLRAVKHWGVRIAAPSRSVADLLRTMDPAWQDIEFTIIPHGLPDLPGARKVETRSREDDRLTLLIPGRIQEGKGKRLLLEALPELTSMAQVCLYGTGKSGEAFFGISGVDVIVQYERDEMAGELERIGPDCAALLSVVPETFSYTLSEMQQLGIPVIATRVGAFEERIADDETGWLIDPDANALVQKVQTLFRDRNRLSGLRDRLRDLELPGCRRMVRRYRELCDPRPADRLIGQLAGLGQSALADLGEQLTRARADLRIAQGKLTETQAQVRKRTAWAEERERARQQEVTRRKKWVAQLQGDIESLQGHITDLGAEITNRDHQILVEQQHHQLTTERLDELQAVHDWVLQTRSWRFTRPFRGLARATNSLMHIRAWNPLRWPFLLSRLIGSLRTRGLQATMNRTQSDNWKPYRAKSVDTSTIEDIGNPEPPARFPFPASPVVSIVIPIYNKWPYTAACLRSLEETKCLASFEVIVVDDQSSDESPQRLQEVKGLVSLRNEENLGFVGSCNRGAQEARGEYIVMLNNDTQVTDGWLDDLLRTFESHPDTGLVGARLVYPDGRLQESGGIVFNDASGWNYGKFDDPDRTDYQFVREADYCSGACIMLSTKLFRELGGFDDDYAPAYYEDTDLAFKVREQGLKVRIQPAATIVHHEGITAGTDLGSGAKRYQAVNRKTFKKKWAKRLADQPPPIVDPTDVSEIRAARDHKCKGRILVIDAYTPEPDQDSGSVRLCQLMQCLLDLGYRVSFMPDNRSHAGNYTRDLQRMGVETLYSPWVNGLTEFFSARGAEFDFVFISRYYVAENYLGLMRKYCPDARLIFDTVDLHYLREERLAELESSLPLRRAAAQTRRAELAVIDRADATLVVSPVEKTILAESAPGARVAVISNIHEVTGSKTPFEDRKDIFFVGGYQHPPNIDAAQWFVSSIWPLIREELPDIEFHLIGSKAPESIRALDGNGVRFHGFVESLDPWLDGCRMAIAPLRYGAGVKGKVNMSMSRGQPVVATPMAVEGMFAEPGKEVLVAETEAEFAQSVVRLYRDENLWNAISSSGLENVRRYFSRETARLGLQELLKSMR